MAAPKPAFHGSNSRLCSLQRLFGKWRRVLTVFTFLAAGVGVVQGRQNCSYPQTNSGKAWAANTAVKVEFGPSVNADQKKCFQSAMTKWSDANTSSGGSGVTFTEGEASSQAEKITVNMENLAPPYSGETLPLPKGSNGYINGNVTVRISSNTDLLDNCDGWEKAMLHELGHAQNMKDINGVANPSVMKTMAGKNDSQGNMASNVTSCDKTVAKSSSTDEEELVDGDDDYVPAGIDCNDDLPQATYECCESYSQEISWCTAGESTWWDYDGPCLCVTSPVIFDLDGDGFSLTNKADGVSFDLDQNGTPEQLPWTARGSDDAWLTLDRNRNGIVDDGSELFGNFSPQTASTKPNGFTALALFDDNGDGWLDRADAVFQRLRLWQDRNHDGLSDSSELLRLGSVGVRAIATVPQESRRQDEWGNIFRYRARVMLSRDSDVRRYAFDVFFVVAVPQGAGR